MKLGRIINVIEKEKFCPTFVLGIWINPFFIIRRGLYKGIKKITIGFNDGKLLDVGCGKKPYEHIFQVEEYLGIDVEVSGHDHTHSKIDVLYDGTSIPFCDSYFDYVFSSEVFEHVFNLDELLSEINRVLKKNGKLAFSCPFVWDEHEQPYDYARYTSFALEHLLSKHGFDIIELHKSTNYVSTIAQMFSAFVFQHMLPRNIYLRYLLTPLFVAPINIAGLLFGAILPKNTDFYHNNIVLAQKKKPSN